jgi:hypothetical protein
MNKKTIIIRAVIVAVLLGAVVAGFVMWNNYQESRRIAREDYEKAYGMLFKLMVADLYGMDAVGLPEQNNIGAYEGSLSSHPGLYTRVEFAQTKPSLEDCEQGVIYVYATAITDRNIHSLNRIIERDSSINLGELSYPVTVDDVRNNPHAAFDVLQELDSYQTSYFRFGTDKDGLYTVTVADKAGWIRYAPQYGKRSL